MLTHLALGFFQLQRSRRAWQLNEGLPKLLKHKLVDGRHGRFREALQTLEKLGRPHGIGHDSTCIGQRSFPHELGHRRTTFQLILGSDRQVCQSCGLNQTSFLIALWVYE